MLLRSLPVAALLMASVPVAVQANPVCYMDMNGQRIDLSYMCGDDQSAPQIAITTPPAQNIPTLGAPESQRQVSATIQILRARYSSLSGVTIVEALVEFGRSSHVGDSVVPTLTTYSGTFSYPRVTLARGRKQYYVNLRLSGQFTQADIRAQLVDMVAVR